MNITIDARALQHSAFRGIGRYAENLIDNIISLDKKNSYTLYFDQNYKLDPHYERFLSLEHVYGEKQPGFLDPKSVFYYRYWMKRQFRALKSDLIHFTSQIYMPPILPRNSVLTVCDVINLALKDMFYKLNIAHWADVRYARKMFNSAKKVIAISEHTKNDLVNIIGMKEEKIEVIYCGIDERFYKDIPKEEIAKTLAKYGINGDYILYYGGSEERKNVRRLLEAFTELNKTFRELKLVLVLNLNEPPSKALKEVCVNKNVIFVGNLLDDELLNILKGARLFAFPSLYEGFGLPVIEANAASVPVASSPASSLEEVLNDSALFFDPLSVEEMYRCMKELLTNQKIRNILIENGRKNARRFSWRDCAEKTVKLYEELSHN